MKKIQEIKISFENQKEEKKLLISDKSKNLKYKDRI